MNTSSRHRCKGFTYPASPMFIQHGVRCTLASGPSFPVPVPCPCTPSRTSLICCSYGAVGF